jgi:Proteasome subunit
VEQLPCWWHAGWSPVRKSLNKWRVRITVFLFRFLGAVDLRGMAYQDRHIATGYGGYIALPLLRDAAEKNPNMSQQQAEDIMKKCLEVLYYRDARSFPKV